jgi:signal peptidase I
MILSMLLSLTICQSGRSDDSGADNVLYSEKFCLKIFEETIDRARSNTWQISDRDRHILTQCRNKFPPSVNTSIPLPTGSQCVEVVKTLVNGGIGKLKEIELPEEQARSIQRCDEVLKYYDLSTPTMSPTFKPTDRLVVDRTIYKNRSPQRGDIILFDLPTAKQQSDAPVSLAQRAIGLPGETVKITNGRVSINGKSLREDYATAPVKDWNQSVIVPENSYFVLGDNRSIVDIHNAKVLVPREAIVGKVIWHFGGK